MSFLPGGNTVPFSYSAGGTAQTSGFAQAGTPPAPGQASGNYTGIPPSGGLASSPNVPRPGTTIDPATGKPHTAGLTRAELEAKKAAAAGAVAFGGAGGLGTSTNVPAPGTSINPETGLPHTAGLTREELAQIQAKGAELLDPTPLNVQARRSSDVRPQTGAEGRRLSDLTGREQAALQLAGGLVGGSAQSSAQKGTTGVSAPVEKTTTATSVPQATERTAASEEAHEYQTAGEMTPGLELPGGWGHIKATPFPGSGPNAPTSLYEDVAEGLDKVGRAAYASIPSPIKDAFSSNPSSPVATTKSKPIATNAQAPRSPTLSAGSPSGRRASAAAIFDQAKEQANKVLADVQGTLQNTQRRASANLGSGAPLLQSVRNYVGEALNYAPVGHSSMVGYAGSHPGAPPFGVAPRFSFPSQESTGAQPGEHTSGAGALPGPSTETGVAILPDEKLPQRKLPSEENQGVLPGETSGGVGALLGKHGETGDAVSPNESASNAYNELNPASGSAGPSGSRGIASHGETTTTAAPVIHHTSGLTTAEVPHIREQAATPLNEEAPNLADEHAGLSTAAAPDKRDEVLITPSAEQHTAPPSSVNETTTPATSSYAQESAPGSSSFNTQETPISTSSFATRSEERSDGAGFAHPVSGGQESSSSTVPVHAEEKPLASTTSPTKSLSTGYGGLAPALPATVLGLGAAKGATDLETAPVASDTVRESAPVTSTPASDVAPVTSTAAAEYEPSPLATVSETGPSNSVSSSQPSSTLSPSSAVPDTRHANDRTTSTASVTAIRHGHEGTGLRGSPLVQDSNVSTSSASEDGPGQRSTTPGTGPNHTTSLAPGNEYEGIGHPATRAVEGATREPATYPTPEHAQHTGTAHTHTESHTDKHTTSADGHHHGVLADERARADDLRHEHPHPIHNADGGDAILTNRAHPGLDDKLAHNTHDEKHTPVHDHLQDPAPHHSASGSSTPHGLLATERARADELRHETPHPIHTTDGSDAILTNKSHPGLDSQLAHNTHDEKHTPLHDHLQDPAPHHSTTSSAPHGVLATERARADDLRHETPHPIHTADGSDAILTNKPHPGLDPQLAHNTHDEKHTPLHDHLQDPAPHHSATSSTPSTPSKAATPTTPTKSSVVNNGRSPAVGSSTPTTPKSALDSGHRRTESGASSEKKKKTGFMSKLKEKLRN
ncbi:hypothetical protein CI109_103955 [Kwoniella shandongensis]|uniref:Uncharacterized protein n=1 Tax=Kwoniella shandongensis TaxID=1734106 RepID=A0A5M6BX60_9TREE|nr:uncharacterized protein CI109_005590 [Kwoniella shandongensis]KAA5525995.1 hypothetical protein CI109_005590 [Kwoniella shandongensis]